MALIEVTVAIPVHPPRMTGGLLTRALNSIMSQTMSPAAVAVAMDLDREGAAVTRNRAWRMADTPYVAFLDSDDELLPQHLEHLATCSLEHDADFVYPWFHVRGGTDPFPEFFGTPWDPSSPHQTTITGLWKRSALEAVGGFPVPGKDLDGAGNRVGEDYLAVVSLNRLGGKIVHLPERTWIWHHHDMNTSGLPEESTEEKREA